MSSFGYGGSILMLPDESGKSYDGPKIILDGFVEDYMPPKDVYSWSEDSVVTVKGKVVTKFIKASFTEQLVEYEDGKRVWFDSREVPFGVELDFRFVGDIRDAKAYTIEEYNLDKGEKKTYKVTLVETAEPYHADMAEADEYVRIERSDSGGERPRFFMLPDEVDADDEDGWDGDGYPFGVPKIIVEKVAARSETAVIKVKGGVVTRFAANTEGYAVEELDLENEEKRIYGITLIETEPMNDHDAHCADEYFNMRQKPVVDGFVLDEDEIVKYKGDSKDIVIPSGVTKIADSAFSGCDFIESVVIPDGVTEIGSSTFSGCRALKNIKIPDSVTEIDRCAFKGCTSLKNITLPKSIKLLSGCTFDECSALKSVTIPNGVEYIGDRAFGDCTGLESIIIPKSVKVIDLAAFSGCTALKSITLPSGLESIRAGAFRDCARLKSLTIPSSVKHIDSCLFSGNTDIEEIVISDKNETYFVDGNCIMEKSAPSVLVSGCGRSVIPDYVTAIGKHAFSGCDALTSITFPGSVTEIQMGAFADCNGLTSVILPGGLIDMGEWVFARCKGLISITIPDGVTKIERNAFYGCESLSDINYTGTKAQWNSIEKNDSWDRGTGRYAVHCTDGDIKKGD